MKNRFLIIAIALIVVIVIITALVINQDIINSHMYPQDAIHGDSNLLIQGIVTSIEENYRIEGFGIDYYHIFRFYIQLNITEIVWITDDLAGIILFSFETNSIYDSNIIGIGYDNLDNPALVLGQNVECKGSYNPATDSPYSFIITVSPSITESYLKP